jgi:glycerophosphoryl diester phosphodiesterase
MRNMHQEIKKISSITHKMPALFRGVIGHRGVAGLAPENTIAAFRLASTLSLSWVEFDARPCLSGEWIIFHDETLERTTNGTGLVSQTTYKIIQSLDAGSWFHPRFKAEKVPLLSEVLNTLSALGIHPNIEIKPFVGEKRVSLSRFLAELRLHWPSHLPLPLVSSFDLEILAILRELSPDLPLGYIVKTLSEAVLLQALQFQCNTVHCADLLSNDAFFSLAETNNLPIFVYTVNDWERSQSLLQQGAAGVFSDLTHPIFIEKLKI